MMKVREQCMEVGQRWSTRWAGHVGWDGGVGLFLVVERGIVEVVEVRTC